MEDWEFGGSPLESERMIKEMRVNIRKYGLERVYRGEEKSGRKYAIGVYLIKALMTEQCFEILASLGPYEPTHLLSNLEIYFLDGVSILDEEEKMQASGEVVSGEVTTEIATQGEVTTEMATQGEVTTEMATQGEVTTEMETQGEVTTEMATKGKVTTVMGTQGEGVGDIWLRRKGKVSWLMVSLFIWFKQKKSARVYASVCLLQWFKRKRFARKKLDSSWRLSVLGEGARGWWWQTSDGDLRGCTDVFL
jgi:hypothetical protein